jgi:hypothetical protein
MVISNKDRLDPIRIKRGTDVQHLTTKGARLHHIPTHSRHLMKIAVNLTCRVSSGAESIIEITFLTSSKIENRSITTITDTTKDMSEDAIIRRENADMSTIQKDMDTDIIVDMAMDTIKNMNDVAAIRAIKTSIIK